MGKTNEMEKNEMQDFTVYKKHYNKLVGVITREYGKVESSSLKIAFALHEIYELKLYEHDSYKNIYEFGEDRFNLSKSTVNGMVNIIEKFALRDEVGQIINGDGAGILPEFEKFTFSKLGLLVSVPKEYLPEFYSTMTAKEIREKKAEIAKLIEAKEAENELLPGEVSEDTETGMNVPETTSDTDSDDTPEESERHHNFVHIMSCTDIMEMAEKFEDSSFMRVLCNQLEAFKKELPIGVVPKIAIGLSYES